MYWSLFTIPVIWAFMCMRLKHVRSIDFVSYYDYFFIHFEPVEPVSCVLFKKSLKIRKWLSGADNRRSTDNTTALWFLLQEVWRFLIVMIFTASLLLPFQRWSIPYITAGLNVVVWCGLDRYRNQHDVLCLNRIS